jgi:hypothetical protein
VLRVFAGAEGRSPRRLAALTRLTLLAPTPRCPAARPVAVTCHQPVDVVEQPKVTATRVLPLLRVDGPDGVPAACQREQRGDRHRQLSTITTCSTSWKRASGWVAQYGR